MTTKKWYQLATPFYDRQVVENWLPDGFEAQPASMAASEPRVPLSSAGSTLPLAARSTPKMPGFEPMGYLPSVTLDPSSVPSSAAKQLHSAAVKQRENLPLRLLPQVSRSRSPATPDQVSPLIAPGDAIGLSLNPTARSSSLKGLSRPPTNPTHDGLRAEVSAGVLASAEANFHFQSNTESVLAPGKRVTAPAQRQQEQSPDLGWRTKRRSFWLAAVFFMLAAAAVAAPLLVRWFTGAF